MKILALIGLLSFSIASQAQNIYFGSISKSAKKTDYCSYKATVPRLLTTESAPAGVKNFVSALNARAEASLKQMEADYNRAIADKSMCANVMYAYQMGQSFRVSNPIGSTVTSLYVLNSGFTGGAHGFSSVSTITFNTLTGDQYKSLGAFFHPSKLNAIKTLIAQKAKEQNPYFDPEGGYRDWSSKHTSIDQIQNFYVAGYGLVIYFQEYEVGSYAEGIIEAKLYWYELEQIGLNGSAAALALMSNRPY